VAMNAQGVAACMRWPSYAQKPRWAVLVAMRCMQWMNAENLGQISVSSDSLWHRRTKAAQAPQL